MKLVANHQSLSANTLIAIGIIVMLEECHKRDHCSRENVSGSLVDLAKSNSDMDLLLPFCSWDKGECQ